MSTLILILKPMLIPIPISDLALILLLILMLISVSMPILLRVQTCMKIFILICQISRVWRKTGAIARTNTIPKSTPSDGEYECVAECWSTCNIADSTGTRSIPIGS